MKANIAEKFEKIAEHWHPYIIGELNDNYVKLAKLKGEFVWHNHQDEDELFVVVKGTLFMEYRDGRILQIRPGEILIVPKGVDHKPFTKDEEVQVMLIEPKATKHTGDVKVEQTVENLEWI
ncbi:MAG: cupin domain-containing protein [Cyclobacteriaceae bacterium]|jgi:mannose-6-phosphate isomerase-like protein (cupin superfamily)|nr:cupin domain-containing protein [Cyclobacteriaceae bacterium]NBP71575.1 cupin domain-containing protein [Cytophagia bacterium]NBW37585.1 cupin domain-containing protein [Cytophagia bacterium]